MIKILKTYFLGNIEESYVNIKISNTEIQNTNISKIFLQIQLPRIKIILQNSYDTIQSNRALINFDKNISKKIIKSVSISILETTHGKYIKTIKFTNIEWYIWMLKIQEEIAELKETQADKDIYITLPIIPADLCSLLRDLNSQYTIIIRIDLNNFDKFIKNKTIHDYQFRNLPVINSFGIISDENVVKYDRIMIPLSKNLEFKPEDDFNYLLKINSADTSEIPKESFLFFDNKYAFLQNVLYHDNDTGDKIVISNIFDKTLKSVKNIVYIPHFFSKKCNELQLQFNFYPEFFRNKKKNLATQKIPFVWFKNVLIDCFFKTNNLPSFSIEIYYDIGNLPSIIPTDKCSISHDEFIDNEIVLKCITCSQLFKKNYIKKWFKVLVSKNEDIKCPYCRSVPGEQYFKIQISNN